MNALLLMAALAALPETAAEVGHKGDFDVVHPERVTNVSISFSPLTTLLLGAAVEAEFRVSDHFTTYLVGEFYGAWMGWGAQTGVRLYPADAFKGFFIDGHARASNLLLNHLIGGGLELGSQHAFGRSRWAFLWSVGLDVGAGGWNYTTTSTPIEWMNEPITVLPKLRLMLAYHF